MLDHTGRSSGPIANQSPCSVDLLGVQEGGNPSQLSPSSDSNTRAPFRHKINHVSALRARVREVLSTRAPSTIPFPPDLVCLCIFSPSLEINKQNTFTWQSIIFPVLMTWIRRNKYICLGKCSERESTFQGEPHMCSD